MTSLTVRACGPQASVQDGGRLGHRRFGVSSAGAMDLDALALANALVGNPAETAAVELPMLGASFEVAGDPVLVAVAGPGVTLTIGGQVVPPGTSARAVPGDQITVGPARGGVYGYLAASGGVETPVELGSRSHHRRSHLGVGLAPGVRLPVQASQAPPLRYGGPDPHRAGPIRYLPGPQFDAFDPASQMALDKASFRINPRSDRMGLRLDGPALHAPEGHDIFSEGVVPGSIQVPGNGTPIVLGRDCQTTGGYPKIATVISADLGRLAQIPFGQEVRFAMVDQDVALASARQAAQARAALPQAMRPVAMAPDLAGHNLISGVIRGDED